jgi:transposase-like protein
MGDFKDLRVKLSQEQKLEIKKLYDSGQKNRGELASEFGVSLGTIHFIVNPESLKRFEAKRVGTWKKYYTTEKAKEWKRNFRTRRGL